MWCHTQHIHILTQRHLSVSLVVPFSPQNVTPLLDFFAKSILHSYISKAYKSHLLILQSQKSRTGFPPLALSLPPLFPYEPTSNLQASLSPQLPASGSWPVTRQHTSADGSIRQHTSAYVSIRQHTSAYIRLYPVASQRVDLDEWICTCHKQSATCKRCFGM